MRLSDDPALRSFVEGVRALFLASTVRVDDPLELFLDAIFGSRTDVSLPLPSAEEMWAAFTDRVSSTGLIDDIVAAYRDHFPSFVRDRYIELLRPAWSESSRAAAFALLRRHVQNPDAWHYLSLRFGFGEGIVGPMSDEKIGSLIGRGEQVVSFSCSRAISTIRASRDAGVLELLSGRAP